MTKTNSKRLPETRSLSQILPKGTEGGKEFARIVDLLLFHEARRNDKNLRLFSDASGDYNGLDSFSVATLRQDGDTGYQYKFFSSPLSDAHRTAIKQSLSATAEAMKAKKLKLKKWILVTPDDFTESARKKTSGDVTWFEGLKEELKLKFDIEHWGHRHLQALFIETRSLCLFYYPDLVNDGSNRRKTIESLLIPYSENLLQLYRRIEFVGMSVYKPEATRGVPMEDIYIPVSTVPNSTAWDDDSTDRIDPLEFLRQGRRQVILGDPGSGKSTLLRFLALVGRSAALQQRCSAQPDARLPILVVLRKYATELKKTPDLPLLEYIIQSVKADFSLNGVGEDFFEYFLDCGQAILLFDGLDELGSSSLKKTVRDRIQALTISYPGNTTIVTSRIVGYDAAFGFDEREFSHHRVGRLRQPEIIQFVEDWYRARIENQKERSESASDLIRILTEDAHAAIQDLSKNPLLLTIIALVHRIDAVLPDERVVLYQKCTETLLNTWHTWKFREDDNQRRGKTERRNRQRIEAIAHWMQTRPRANTGDARAVVKKNELAAFLTNFINTNEPAGNDEDAADLAEDFLEFVRQRAGLLIEVGDNQFSFVHLTFQEYLAASWFKTRCERDGVEAVWNSLADCVGDSAWHEVMRLLVASLSSDDAQEVLVCKLLEFPTKCDGLELLVAGLLADGVEAAELRREPILRALLNASSGCDDVGTLRKFSMAVRACDQHDGDSRACLDDVVRNSWESSSEDTTRLATHIILLLAGRPPEQANMLTERVKRISDSEAAILALLSGSGSFPKKPSATYTNQIADRLTPIALRYIAESPNHNLCGTALATVIGSIDPKLVSHILFRLSACLFTQHDRNLRGPFSDFHFNIVALALHQSTADSSDSLWDGSILSGIVNGRRDTKIANRIKSGEMGRDKHLTSCLSKIITSSESRHLLRIQPLGRSITSNLNQNLATSLDRSKDRQRDRYIDLIDMRTNVEKDPNIWNINELWLRMIGHDIVGSRMSYLICAAFDLQPKPHILEAIEKLLLPTLPKLVPYVKRKDLEHLQQKFVNDTAMQEDLSSAAWLLLLDAAVWALHGYKQEEDSRLEQLALLTKSSSDARLIFAHCIRDLSYGKRERSDDLNNIIQNPDEEMSSLLRDIGWDKPQHRKSKRNTKKQRLKRQ